MLSTNTDPWFVGIDLGTGSCKSVVIDEQAHVLGFGVSDYAGADVHEKWNEQDPEAMLASMVRSVRIAVNNAGVSARGCRSLSIGSALHSLVAVDRSGRPITGVITWADGRGAPQAEVMRQSPQADHLYHQTGCPAHGMYPFYKTIWLREERPEIFKQAARFISAKEYVITRLTGQYLVDYSVAAGSGFLNTHDLSWNPASLALAGIKAEQLSPLGNPRELVGSLEPELAAEMGISPDALLVLGSSDAVNSSIGAGAVLPWQATCMIGTSGAFRIIAPQPLLDAHARTWCYVIDEKHWLAGGAINNGGIALSWLRDTLNGAFPGLTQEMQLSFDDLMRMAGEAGTGAAGLLCLPFFAGERSPNWNLNSRAVFFGLNLQHNAGHIARALLEGVAFRLRSLNDVLNEMGWDVGEIRASGGFTRSDLWLQIIASALNRDLIVPSWGETSSLGASFWAMLGTGVLSKLEETTSFVPVGNTYRPSLREIKIYNRLYKMYKELYAAMGDAFDEIAEIQNNCSNNA